MIDSNFNPTFRNSIENLQLSISPSLGQRSTTIQVLETPLTTSNCHHRHQLIHCDPFNTDIRLGIINDYDLQLIHWNSFNPHKQSDQLINFNFDPTSCTNTENLQLSTSPSIGQQSCSIQVIIRVLTTSNCYHVHLQLIHYDLFNVNWSIGIRSTLIQPLEIAVKTF